MWRNAIREDKINNDYDGYRPHYEHAKVIK
jgi:hypothetical protein